MTETITALGYVKALRGCLFNLPTDDITELAGMITTCKGIVYSAGNGGSAANAMHLTCDLVKSGVRSVCLSGSTPLLTAMVNDEGAEYAFSGALKQLGKRADMLVAFSGSGTSPNIVECIEAAIQLGVTPVLITGQMAPHGGLTCAGIMVVEVPSDDMQIIEDCHSAIIHVIKKLI